MTWRPAATAPGASGCTRQAGLRQAPPRAMNAQFQRKRLRPSDRQAPANVLNATTLQRAPSLPPSPHPPLLSLSCSQEPGLLQIVLAAGNRVNNCPANGELAASIPFTTDCSLAGKQEDVVEVSRPVSVRPPIAREDPGDPPTIKIPPHLPNPSHTIHSHTPYTYTLSSFF